MADELRWQQWGKRFRELIREKESNLEAIAEKMKLAESTLRSWTNGTRKINLEDFFALCAAAEVDAAMVLFGRPIMTEAQRKAIGELTTSILDADPASSPSYQTMGDNIRKSVRARKAAEAKATSRLKIT